MSHAVNIMQRLVKSSTSQRTVNSWTFQCEAQSQAVAQNNVFEMGWVERGGRVVGSWWHRKPCHLIAAFKVVLHSALWTITGVLVKSCLLIASALFIISMAYYYGSACLTHISTTWGGLINQTTACRISANFLSCFKSWRIYRCCLRRLSHIYMHALPWKAVNLDRSRRVSVWAEIFATQEEELLNDRQRAL